MKSRITKLAAAAVIMTMGLLAYYHTGSVDGASVAWADVAKKIENFAACTFRKVQSQRAVGQKNAEIYKSLVYISSEYGQRIDGYSDDFSSGVETYTYASLKEKTYVSVIPSMKIYMKNSMSESSLEAMKKADFREVIKKWMSVEFKKLGRKTIDGIEVEGIEIYDPSTTMTTGGTIETFKGRLWVDVKTYLPVMQEIEMTCKEEGIVREIKITSDQFQWNPEFDSSTFEPNVPSDYELIKN
jgi:outer membrane lipoprotein-sorting protein